MAVRESIQIVLSGGGQRASQEPALVIESKNGTSHGSDGLSLSSLFSTLLPTFLLAVLMISTFLVLRKRERRVYSPRTYTGVLRDDEMTPEASPTLLVWVKDFWALPDTYVLNHQSLDAYLYLRFFKVLITISLLGVFVTWPILFPVNATGGAGLSQLDSLTIGNIDSSKSNRCYAHAIVGCIFLGLVMLVITRETMYFINLRLAFLSSARNASRLSSRTVLFTSVPDILLSEAALKRSLDGVKHVWIATECNEAIQLVKEFNGTALTLENATIQLAKDANKAYLKFKSKSNNSGTEDNETRSDAEAAINNTKRPSHRLKPWFGDRVDTIDWSRQSLEHLQPKIDKARLANQEGFPLSIPVAFVEFDTQSAAQVAYQQGFAEESLLAPRYTGVTPGEVIWENLGIRLAQRQIRMYLATAAISMIILFWTVPVAIIGTISNIDRLTSEVAFLRFLHDLPPQLLGLITGLLPTVLLSSLMSLVPIICRFFARLGGEVTCSGIENTTQTWYFAFQVTQVFLITTFSSGAASVAAQLWEDPTMAAHLLAKNLPKASNFYISYFVLFGLVTSSTTVLNVLDFLMINFVGKIMDTTPRKKYERHRSLTGVGWGSYYPKYTNLGVIAIAYSCIAPLVLGFATIGLSLLYLAFRYNALYATSTQIDTRGAAYGRALRQLTAGVYISAFCLIGLFSIRKAYGPLLIMLIFLVLTVLYHCAMDLALNRLTRFLPSFLDDAEATENSTGEANAAYDEESIPSRIAGKISEQFSVDPTTVNEHFLRYDRTLARYPRAKPSSDNPHHHKIEPPSHFPNFLVRLFNSNLFRVASSSTLSDTILDSSFSELVEQYSDEVEKNAYLHPALRTESPKLWIVRDEAGISKAEVEMSNGVVEVEDRGAWLDEKNRVVWEVGKITETPLWKADVRY